MAKIALLIGVSEYGPGLNPLPNAVRDVEAMQQVLQPLEIGGFDEVKRLSNPNPPVMREAIETLFSNRSQDDLVLLLFSGYVIRDDNSTLYFATTITRQSPRAEIIRVSAIPISFVHQLMSNSPCQRQVVILDCCLSGVSENEMEQKDDVVVDIKTKLGGKGRNILASFTSLHNSPNLPTSSHSVYTNYLVEAIRTRASDLDSDGWISVEELHEYASQKTQITAPTSRLEFYSVAYEDNIRLCKSPLHDTKLAYSKEIEAEAQNTLNLANLSESEDELDDLEQADNPHKSNSVLSGQKTVLQNELDNVDNQNKSNLVISGQKTVLQQATRILPPHPNNPNSAFSDDTNDLDNVDNQNKSNSVLSGQKTVLQQATSILRSEPTNPTSPVKSSSLTGTNTNHYSVSSFPNKLLLVTGIGGAFVTVTLAWAIGIYTRKPVAPPANIPNKVLSSPSPSPKLSPTTKKSQKKPNPTPTASAKSPDCTIIVNGNLRSTPVSAQNNVVESLKDRLPVTGKRADDDWVQVKLSSGKLAWAHPEIISTDSESEMEACLAKQKKKKT